MTEEAASVTVTNTAAVVLVENPTIGATASVEPANELVVVEIENLGTQGVPGTQGPQGQQGPQGPGGILDDGFIVDGGNF